MKTSWIMVYAALGAAAGAQQAPQVAPAAKVSLPTVPVEEIIQKFAAKESEFARARENYTYRQTVRVQEIDEDGAARGKHEMVSDIIFSPAGKRLERVIHAPVATLKRISLDPGDEQDLRNVQPFVLTTVDIPKYKVSFLGPQKVDELDTYVFAVKPKAMESGQRYFEGQVWVDQQDLQIVKSYGKGVGVQKKGSDHQYPRFETYRDQIDGKFWFPVLTRADDILHFQNGDQRVRMTVKYENYKQFRALSDIQYEGVVGEKKEPEKKEPKK